MRGGGSTELRDSFSAGEAPPAGKSTRRAYSGKFRRRRREWKFLPLGNLLRVLGTDGLGAAYCLCPTSVRSCSRTTTVSREWWWAQNWAQTHRQGRVRWQGSSLGRVPRLWAEKFVGRFRPSCLKKGSDQVLADNCDKNDSSHACKNLFAPEEETPQPVGPRLIIVVSFLYI